MSLTIILKGFYEQTVRQDNGVMILRFFYLLFTVSQEQNEQLLTFFFKLLVIKKRYYTNMKSKLHMTKR